MKRLNAVHVLFLPLLFVLSAGPAAAQRGSDNEPYYSSTFSLRGTHTVVVNAGFWSVASRATATPDDSQAGGFVGSISHRYWLTDNWGVGPFLSILDTGAKTLNASSNTSQHLLLTSILFGVDYAFVPASSNINVIFYLSGAVGPYMSSTARLSPGDEAISVTAFGARPQIGMDWYLNNWLVFEFAFGYHIISDFQEPVGGDKNYSGPEFSMGVGLAI